MKRKKFIKNKIPNYIIVWMFLTIVLFYILGGFVWAIFGLVPMSCGYKCFEWARKIKKIEWLAFGIGWAFGIWGLLGYWFACRKLIKTFY